MRVDPEKTPILSVQQPSAWLIAKGDGKTTVLGCVTEATMAPEHEYWFTWKFGPYGIVLADAEQIPFIRQPRMGVEGVLSETR